MAETIDLRVRIRALIATLDRLALRAFTRHGDDAQLYNGLKDAVSELEAISVLQGEAAPPPDVTCDVSPIHGEEDGTGPLESTDLFLQGRGISLLCNVEAGQRFTYSLDVDKQQKQRGVVGDAPEVIRTPQCPHGEDCACAISTRHEWFVAFCDERDKAQTPAPPQGWQPIDTAPKDGRRVLVAFDWTGHVSWAHYDSRGDDEWKVCGVVGGQPTHWMPLPAPPLVSESPQKEKA